MVKTVIGGIDVQKYITRYSCQCSPVNGNNYFHDINGEYFSDKLGDEVSLNITLEEVPTPLSVQLAEALEAESVVVDYTRATVNGNMGTVRTHLYTDDLGAWQDLELDRCNWTCADGTGQGNMQTIAIECIMSIDLFLAIKISLFPP